MNPLDHYRTMFVNAKKNPNYTEFEGKEVLVLSVNDTSVEKYLSLIGRKLPANNPLAEIVLLDNHDNVVRITTVFAWRLSPNVLRPGEQRKTYPIIVRKPSC